MASEIRVNKIENRSGLGTVTFADTGVDLAGIVTATTFSGSGASLTNVPDSALSAVTASKLSGALPAISAASLTNVPAANVVGVHTSLTVTNATTTGTAVVGGGVTISESGIEASGIGITCANINGTQIGGRRNLIINGAMEIAQRSTSASTTNGFATLDRFKTSFTGTDESPTQEQADVASGTTPYTSGFRKCFKLTNGNQTSGAGVSDRLEIQYMLEAQDVAKSGWNYTSASSFITLSFWMKSSVAQAFFVRLQTQDGTQYRYKTSTGSLSADTWTKITKTIPGNSNLQFDNNGNAGLRISFYAFAGTNYSDSSATETWAANETGNRTSDMTSTWYTTNDATLEVTGVQLEVGSQATSFEFRSTGEELKLCQRYFQKYISPRLRGVIGSSGTAINRMGMTLITEMRANPSSTWSGNQDIYDGGGTAQITGISAPYVDHVSYEMDATVSGSLSNGSGACVCSYLDGNEATLSLDAEI